MSDRTAKHAFITEAEPGVILLNLCFEGEPGISRGVAHVERVQISEAQAAYLGADCAKICAAIISRGRG